MHWRTRNPSAIWSGVVLCLALALAPLCAQAGDWPQILGPNRRGVAEMEELADAWPEAGPTVVWRRDVGQGYAGVAVAQGTLVLFHRVGDEEVAEGLNPVDGSRIWKRGFPTEFSSRYSSDHGPRCVPLIHDGAVYLCGARRATHRLSLADGSVEWSRELFEDYNHASEEGYFGAGSTPIVAQDKLLLNLGGAKAGAGLIALSLATGETIWKATDELASYSSPVAAIVGGRPQVVFVTRFNTLGVDAQDGTKLWSFPFGARGPTVNGANPLVIDGHVFVSASYGVGAAFVDIRGERPKQVWKNEVMSSQYATCVERDGWLYGSDGRDDVGGADLKCLDPQTGEVAWTEEGFGAATLILADDKLLIQKTSGELVLARANPKKFEKLASVSAVPPKSYALPALADGLYYVRGEKELRALDLRP